MALTREQQSRYDIAKWRWRADLYDYDAALEESIGHDAAAAEKRGKAAWLRADAAAHEAFEDIIDEFGGNSPEGNAAAEALRQHRNNHRTEPVEVGTADGYNEPTAAELGVI